jgi:hypothetical protein
METNNDRKWAKLYVAGLFIAGGTKREKAT